MIWTLCFWKRKGNFSDEVWVLVKIKERRKKVFLTVKKLKPFSSQQLVGAAASFEDLSSRCIQHEHESCNRRVVSGSSRSGLGALVADGLNDFVSGVETDLVAPGPCVVSGSEDEGFFQCA